MLRAENSLEKRINQSFLDVPKPNVVFIAPHPCEECSEICQAFAPFEFQNIPDEVIMRHYDLLPLLSPLSLHHYLPAYLLYALKHPESEVFEFLLYQLGPSKQDRSNMGGYDQERVARFTTEQRLTILAFLDWASETEEGKWHDEHLQNAYEIWAVAA